MPTRQGRRGGQEGKESESHVSERRGKTKKTIIDWGGRGKDQKGKKETL